MAVGRRIGDRWFRSLTVLLGAAGIAAVGGACSEEATYDGAGTDHPFAGRSLSEIQPCAEVGCGVGGVNEGTLDGVVVRIVQDLSDGETLQQGDAACIMGRVDLVVDGDTIVAATESCS